jgi:3-hydroxyacyl-[acyl-carrier-protein] dehydratase
MEPMTTEQIKEYLPHRYPFLLLDRIVEWEKDKRIVALKNVTSNEPFFEGHFPHYAVMPGVLIIEAMAQAAAMLGLLSAGQKNDGNNVYYFVGIDDARFKRPVRPGDQLVIEVEQLRLIRGIGKFKAVARVDGDVASEGELLCALRPV